MRILYSAVLSTFLLFGCNVNKNTSNTNGKPVPGAKVTRTKTPRADRYDYQPSATRVHDLQHTALDIRFDYKHQYVIGKATIDLKPHFYPTDSLTLDAKKFLLNRVALIQGKDTLPLKYAYDEKVIRIKLNKVYAANEVFRIFVDYTARPNETEEKGSAAISDAKGLYFINPTGDEPEKPRQIWSQGETQSNSCWFPTIDVPNQKMTQEIRLTVDKKDVTLSNGELLMSKDNNDGTRTDYWKQSLPHAPYLTMIVVGEFAIVKDYWRDNMEVNYYVEPAYKPYARLVFGHTPEMIECFSKTLGVDYPWEKFSQVVVRDFVSGAMENTTAVVHFEPLQHNNREHLDNTFEDVISHELFHHWFGDLVTCESWSNIPLNESFATYGEYIWNNHKYGRMHADREMDQKLTEYLSSSNNFDRIPIRYRYKSREDMFDAVSYQKGGRILHMLRKYVGDSAFFLSLKNYLNENKFSTVEIHTLRMAFEKVTGEDLNWFFNQWFLQAGHPVLKFDYETADGGKQVTVRIKQTQDTTKYGIYRLPIAIDVYSDGKTTRYERVISKTAEQFVFQAPRAIQLVNVDAEKVLVAEIEDHQTKPQLAYQFLNAPLYADKWFALRTYTGDSTVTADSTMLVMADYALAHPFYGIRLLGTNILSGAKKNDLKQFEFRLRQLTKTDSSAAVRTEIIHILAKYDAQVFQSLFEEKLNDSSYQVSAAALLGLHAADEKKAVQRSRTLEKENNGALLAAIATIYSRSGDSSSWHFFRPAMARAGNYRYSMLQDYWEYTMTQMPVTQIACITDLRLYQATADYYAHYINKQLAGQMLQQVKEVSDDLRASLKKQKKGSEQETNINRALTDLDKIMNMLEGFGD